MSAMNLFALLTGYLLLGGFAGLVAGLLGVGGGLIIVPVLVGLYGLQGFSGEHVMQLAVGTSLATILFTALSSSWAHHRRGAVEWSIVLQLSLGILAGGWLGGVLAVWIGGVILAGIFGLFELTVAAQMAFGRQPAAHRTAPGTGRNAVAGSIIGAVSALLGIGGGTLTVPWLVWHNVGMRRAVATSAACGLPIALVGLAGFVWAGWRQPGLPEGSTGYVYWPAVLAVSIASISSAPLGARLAHRLNQERLKKVFAGFLAMLGLVMLLKGTLGG
jgi:uncharacterized membrane protein YfcA